MKAHPQFARKADVPSREAWQRLRDGAGLKKGYIKASVGDTLHALLEVLGPNVSQLNMGVGSGARLEAAITAIKNGPYKVEGPIDLFYDEARVDTKGATAFLCRCGASSKKPFCDGTHSKIGFEAAARTVPESREG